MKTATLKNLDVDVTAGNTEKEVKFSWDYFTWTTYIYSQSKINNYWPINIIWSIKAELHDPYKSTGLA